MLEKLNKEGLVQHLKNAIAINRERYHQYARLSNGKSRIISCVLVGSEYLLLPSARILECWIRKFNSSGIPILQNDFVPMDVNQINSTIKHVNLLTTEEWKTIRQRLLPFKSKLQHALNQKDMLSTQQVVKMTLSECSKIESEYGIYLSMTKHILESLWLNARNGKRYEAMSQGKTISTSLMILKSHYYLVRPSLWLDKLANPVQMQEVGILVNDLPKIEINNRLKILPQQLLTGRQLINMPLINNLSVLP